MTSYAQGHLSIERIFRLERENSQLRAIISTRDSEIMDLENQIKELKHKLYIAEYTND